MTNMFDFAYASIGEAITIFGEVHPSGVITANMGKVTSERRFLVPSAYAQQFALRMIGKWYDPVNQWTSPWLPAPFPKSTDAIEPEYTQRLDLVATTWSIEPMSICCFTNAKVKVIDEDTTSACTGPIENVTSLIEAARYYGLVLVEIEGEDETTYELQLPEGSGADQSCLSVVTISYQEPPWDCENRPNSSNVAPFATMMPNTAISLERHPSYEMFTAPNRALKWKDVNLPDGRLAADSYATIIVPKADITVLWFNVPVMRLCEIETHLSRYRGTVNSVEYDLFKDCLCDSMPASFTDCSETGDTYCQYRPNTLLFVDFQNGGKTEHVLMEQ